MQAYYWQSIKNGLIDQDLRTLQTDYHSQSQTTHGIFAYFQAMRKISGLALLRTLMGGIGSTPSLTVSRRNFGVQDNQMVVTLVPACGEKQGQGQDGMTSLVLKAKTLFVKKSYIDECG